MCAFEGEGEGEAILHTCYSLQRPTWLLLVTSNRSWSVPTEIVLPATEATPSSRLPASKAAITRNVYVRRAAPAASASRRSE